MSHPTVLTISTYAAPAAANSAANSPGGSTAAGQQGIQPPWGAHCVHLVLNRGREARNLEVCDLHASLL